MSELEDAAYNYFLLLSKVEYALKNSGFVVSGRKDTASPYWDGFIGHVHENLVVNAEDDDIKEFLKNPPKKQLYKDGVISWSTPDTIRPDDRQELMQACLTVRNNLFHGAKNNDGNAGRNIILIRAAQKILNAAIAVCPKVKIKFDSAEL